MIATAQETRARHRIEELCGAAVRALTDEPSVTYRGHRLHRGGRPLPVNAPHVRLTADDTLRTARGAADGHALRLLHSDLSRHGTLMPDDPVERLVFESLEQFRVESLVDDRLPGLRRNLRHRHEQWSLAFHHSGLTDSARGILIYTVLQTCRARVTGDRIVTDVEDGVEATRFGIVPTIGHALGGLRETRHDQEAYAEIALGLARLVARMVERTADAEEGDEDPDDDERIRADLALLLEQDDGGEDVPTARSGDSRSLSEGGHDYQVFTREHDRVDSAADVVRPDALRSLRTRLDELVADQGVNVPRLAQRLQSALSIPAQPEWEGGRDEGYVDAARLTRLVTSPTDRRLFRMPEPRPRPDTRVTFLVDCSGSMRQHLEHLAPLLDVLVRALDLAGIPCELLGFTTRSWNGGRARRDWNRAGRPPLPGRLNETQHLVFKAAGSTYRRSRLGVAALLRDDLFREGVDGEAVEWAAGRMGDDPDERRVLVVVSDGSPMDTATSLTNDEFYLDHHLRDVVAGHGSARDVDVRGLGVALDLTPYYATTVALDLAHEQPGHVVREITDLVSPTAR